MKSEGLISQEDENCVRLEELNQTANQRQVSVKYEPGNVIEFHKPTAGGGPKPGCAQQHASVRRF